MRRLIITETQYKSLIKESHAFQEMIQIAYNLVSYNGGTYYGPEGEKLKRAYSPNGTKTGPIKFESSMTYKGIKTLVKLILDEHGVLEISIDNKIRYKRPEHISNMIKAKEPNPKDQELEEEFNEILETFNEVIKQSRLDQLNSGSLEFRTSSDYLSTAKNAKERNETIPEYLYNRFFGGVSGSFYSEINEIDRRAPKSSTIYIFNQKLKEIAAKHPAFIYGEPINAILESDKSVKEKYSSPEEMDALIEFYYENLP